MHAHKNLPLNSFVMPVLRELAHEVAKPLSIILEKSWQSGKGPTYWKRRNLFSKRKTRKTWGVTDQSPHLKVRAWIIKHEVAVVQLLEYKQICDLVNSAHLKRHLAVCGNVEIQCHRGFILIKDCVIFCT